MELGSLQHDITIQSFDTGTFAWAQDGLETKRRRAAGHLVPRLRNSLGAQAWVTLFHEHMARYTPAGMLHHVDDAWAFAESIERTTQNPDIYLAGQDDLVSLRLRYVRDPKQTAFRIRERRGPLLAMLHTPQRAMVVKLPGTPGRLWYVRV
ncbi:MAG TPA: hypothetical protein VNM67_11805 [Thermoanaerobaculia bacterium]|jgi:hypothetical protein|nr:hypothetical protein [Thermoanaerobaculia bacterium]